MEAFGYMEFTSLGLMGVAANTVRAFAIFWRELEDIGIVVNPAKTIALPPKGHALTAEEISLLERVDVYFVYRRRRRGDGGGCPDRHGRIRAEESS